MNLVDTGTYELTIYTETPWEPICDVDIISVMAILYKRNCPYSLMRKVFGQYESEDKALVFCGSKSECELGQRLFSESGITSYVSEV